jgi:hypothetical protein
METGKWRPEKGKGRMELAFRSPFSFFPSPYFSVNAASSVSAELVPTNTLKSPGSLTS